MHRPSCRWRVSGVDCGTESVIGCADRKKLVLSKKIPGIPQIEPQASSASGRRGPVGNAGIGIEVVDARLRRRQLQGCSSSIGNNRCPYAEADVRMDPQRGVECHKEVGHEHADVQRGTVIEKMLRKRSVESKLLRDPT